MIDVDTGRKVLNLTDSAIVDLDTLGMDNKKPSYTVVAVGGEDDIGDIGSVRFDYNGVEGFSTEYHAPWSMCGDYDSKFFKCNPEVGFGQHSIVATPVGWDGSFGESFAIQFRLSSLPRQSL